MQQYYFQEAFHLYTLFFITAIEYSEEAMGKSVYILSRWKSFITRANAYIRGDLDCKPINTTYLAQRYCASTNLKK